MSATDPFIRVAVITGKPLPDHNAPTPNKALSVSDTASVDPSADKSGPIIKAIVLSQQSCQVQDTYCAIVPDDKEAIETLVVKWCSSGSVDWIITTGGTGFGVRDVTPEAIAPIIERPAPGLVHLMLSSSLKQTPLAALSRPVAGTIQNTLITTLPGSPKAVKENLEALFQAGLIEHAIDLIKGGSGHQVHSTLSRSKTSQSSQHGSSMSHHHHHHHHDPEHHHHSHHHTPTPRSEGALSHDPSASVSARHRKSLFLQISLEAALDLIRENIHVLPVQERKVDHKLGGYVLAEDVYAPQNVPFTSTTSVDGYALRSSDPPGTYTVLTSQTHSISSPLPPGFIYRINTGGPLPAGTDAVIMVEDTELVSTIQDSLDARSEEKEVRTLVQIPAGENVRAPGSDVRKGDVVMSAGERITRGGGEIGTLAFVGRKEVHVYRKPVVAIMSTGNEIIDLSSDSPDQASIDGWGGIYDTNRPSLAAVLESLGYEVIDLGIVPDEISAHVNTLQKGLELADLILTTGGTSMGPTDLLKPVIERYLSGTIHFGRVGIKPGKPTTFATVPVLSSENPGGGGGDHDAEENAQEKVKEKEKENLKEEIAWRKPIFALPGNPASALVTFYVFVLPALRRMGGWEKRLCELPTIMVQVQNPMPFDPRVEFHRVVIKSSRTSTEAFGASPSPFPVSGSGSASANGHTTTCTLKAYSTGGQRSSRVASLAGANGLVILPALVMTGTGTGNGSVKTRLEVGEFARAIVIGNIEME